MSEASPWSTLTSTTILDGLRDPQNHGVWDAYVRRYRPLLLRYGHKLGLSDTDADDVAQQILSEFCRAYQQGKYDRTKGRLRHWLFGIARNQVRNWQRRAAPPAGVPDGANSCTSTDFFARLPDDARMEALWEEEWRNTVLAQAMAQIRDEVEEHTFRAFHMFAYEGRPAEVVARELGTTANAIFSAKRRILRRLRELLPQVEDAW